MSDEKSLRKIFAEFDTDKSGRIDLKEMKNMVKAYYEVLGLQVDDKTIKDTCYDMMKNLDSDCDGTISLQEWLALKQK